MHRRRLSGVQILGSRDLSEDSHWTGVIDIRRDQLQHVRTLVYGGTACTGINKLDVADSAFCDISLQFQIFRVEIELGVNDKFGFRFFPPIRRVASSPHFQRQWVFPQSPLARRDRMLVSLADNGLRFVATAQYGGR